jgi:hypothetical protein
MTDERRERLAAAEELKRQAASTPRKPAPRPAPKRSAPKRTPAKAPEVDYAEAVKGLFSIPAAVLIVVGQRAHSLPLLADSVTLQVHGEHVANAAAELAETDPRWAAAIEKIATFGPYGAFFGAALPMVAQLATNHGAPVTLTQMFGAQEPEKFLADNGIVVQTESPQSQDGKQPADAQV